MLRRAGGGVNGDIAGGKEVVGPEVGEFFACDGHQGCAAGVSCDGGGEAVEAVHSRAGAGDEKFPAEVGEGEDRDRPQGEVVAGGAGAIAEGENDAVGGGVAESFAEHVVAAQPAWGEGGGGGNNVDS